MTSKRYPWAEQRVGHSVHLNAGALRVHVFRIGMAHGHQWFVDEPDALWQTIEHSFATRREALKGARELMRTRMAHATVEALT